MIIILYNMYCIISQVLGTEAIDVTEVFIRLQKRQVVYNVAILTFITFLLIFFVRGNYKIIIYLSGLIIFVV